MSITVYTNDTCAFCYQLKRWLGVKKHEYNEINVSQQPEREQDIIKLLGYRIFPTILVERDGKKDVVGGYNLGALSSLLT